MHSLSRAVILVVEDEPLIRHVVEDELTEAGFEVLAAANADEALSILMDRPDAQVLFTDHNMPGSMSGTELGIRIRQRKPDMVILVTTGRGLLDVELPEGALLIPKPYKISTLPEVIRKALDSSQADATAAPTSIVIPTTSSFTGLGIDLGLEGGLAQPLQEPED